MKICVIGAGPVGCFVAGHLAYAGLCEASLLARGEALAAIAREGVTVTAPTGHFTAPVRVTDQAADLGVQDVIFVAMKPRPLAAALPQFAHLIGPDTVVVHPANGIPYWFLHDLDCPWRDQRIEAIDPGGGQWRTMDPARVIGAVMWAGIRLTAPGQVMHDGGQAGCSLGEPGGAVSDRVRAIADLMNRSGMLARVRSNIRGDIWMQATHNLCFNPVAALTHARMGDMAAQPGVVALLQAMVAEVDALAVRLGVFLPYSPERRISAALAASGHRMALLQDLEAGRPLDWPSSAASLCALRDLVGLATPTLDAVLALMDLRQARYAAHASL